MMSLAYPPPLLSVHELIESNIKLLILLKSVSLLLLIKHLIHIIIRMLEWISPSINIES